MSAPRQVVALLVFIVCVLGMLALRLQTNSRAALGGHVVLLLVIIAAFRFAGVPWRGVRNPYGRVALHERGTRSLLLAVLLLPIVLFAAAWLATRYAASVSALVSSSNAHIPGS